MAPNQVNVVVRGADKQKKEKTGISLATSCIIVFHQP
jgi:hypothetical protein